MIRDAPWIVQAPSSWGRTYLGHVVNVVSGATPSKDEPSFWTGEIPWVSPKDMKVFRLYDAEDHVSELAVERTALRWVPSGSVLMVTRGMILDHTVPIALAERPLTINQDMKALVPRGDLDGSYLGWLLVGLNRPLLARVEEAAHGAKALRTEQWKALPIVVPPVGVQRDIAEFLHTRTAALDELIAKKERLVSLLREKRQALITQAVTRGLERDATVATGDPVLPALPPGWSLEELRQRISGIEQGWSPSCEGRPAEEHEWGVLKVGCVNYGRFSEQENKALPPDLTPLPRLEIHPGDVLVSRANTRELVGSAAFVRHARPRLLLCDKLFRIRYVASRTDPEFLTYLLQSRICRAQLERDASGASGSMQNIGQDSIRRLKFGWPSLDEQREIVRHLDLALTHCDRSVSLTTKSLDKLREYRQALITAAVTGQIDVTRERAA